jgi:prepilin-type N-terminal cleavage/methylation domain-containing protein
MKRLPEKRSEQGFSLVEMLVAIAIGGAILGSMVGGMTAQGRSASYQQGLADAQLTSRAIGHLFQQDLRMAGYGMLGVGADTGLSPLSYAAPTGRQELILRGAFGDVRSALLATAGAGSSAVHVAVGPNFVEGEHQYPMGTKVIEIEQIVWALENGIFRRNGSVMGDNLRDLQLEFIDHEGEVSSAPTDDLRAVKINLRSAQATGLPDNPEASSSMQTEVNVRNLAFRFQMG